MAAVSGYRVSLIWQRSMTGQILKALGIAQTPPLPLEIAAAGAFAFGPNQRPPFSLSAFFAHRARFFVDCHGLRTVVNTYSVSPGVEAIVEIFVGEPVGCAHSAE